MRFLLSPSACLATLCLPVLSQTVPWDGEWRLVPGESDQTEPLIEAHLKGQNIAAKLLWRRRLRAACQTYPNLDILLGEVFSVTFGKELPADTPTDGTTRPWKRSDGALFQVSMKQEDGHILQTLQGSDYTLTNAYVLSQDGLSLTLQVTYASPKRAVPFSYRLAYRKLS